MICQCVMARFEQFLHGQGPDWVARSISARSRAFDLLSRSSATEAVAISFSCSSASIFATSASMSFLVLIDDDSCCCSSARFRLRARSFFAVPPRASGWRSARSTRKPRLTQPFACHPAWSPGHRRPRFVRSRAGRPRKVLQHLRLWASASRYNDRRNLSVTHIDDRYRSWACRESVSNRPR